MKQDLIDTFVNVVKEVSKILVEVLENVKEAILKLVAAIRNLIQRVARNKANLRIVNHRGRNKLIQIGKKRQ